MLLDTRVRKVIYDFTYAKYSADTKLIMRKYSAEMEITMKMNKKQADALCAIIALGFIGQNQREEGTGRTLYIYDSASDAEKHLELADLLNRRFGINIASDIQNAKDPSGRKVFPFIYALPYQDENRLDYFTAVMAEADNIAEIVRLTEEHVNLSDKTRNSRGAYIGGFIDFEKHELSLIGPSSLYVRDYEYIDASSFPANMKVIFDNFSDVTKKLNEFIREKAPTLSTSINIDNAYGKVLVAPELTESLISEGTPEDSRLLEEKRKVIASCHGLVTSMYHHSTVSRERLGKGVCIEFSLSDGTCKSASCIPCAIFAAAQGTPATQVHFGRGDFWNLPKPSLRATMERSMEEAWRLFVTACYVSASDEILTRNNFPPETITMASLAADLSDSINEIIPDMFLDALTFEGSFIQKMLDSFQIIP